jgi:hypothetical protein
MSKYLNAREFCELVLDRKIKLPKEINIHGRKKKQITKLFGWFETIQSCGHYNHFRITSPKACQKIEEMNITKAELLSLLLLWQTWKEIPDRLFFKSEAE